MQFDLNELFQNEVFQTVLHLVAAIAVFFIGRWLAQRARVAASIGLGKTPLAPSMTRLILLVVYYGLLAIMLMIILALIGFPVESLLVPALLIAAILGIALQQSIANLAATVMFMLFQPFKVGEVIKSNDVLGTVKEIQFFSVVLLTGDNVEVTIPSSKIQGDTLLNYTRQGQRRVDFVFGVGYQDDLDHVTRVLRELLAADPRVLPAPEPLVYVQELGESSVNVAVRPWVKTSDYLSLQQEFPRQVKTRFDTEGISIPFPQREVRLISGAAPTGA
jgi:small conductance mechanosensitive channel